MYVRIHNIYKLVYNNLYSFIGICIYEFVYYTNLYILIYIIPIHKYEFVLTILFVVYRIAHKNDRKKWHKSEKRCPP